MVTTIQKWGNSNGVRIPKSFLETVSIKENDRVEIAAENGVITIRKATRKYKSLDELFAGFVGKYPDTGISGPLGCEGV